MAFSRQLGAFPNSVATRRGVAALPLYPHWLRIAFLEAPSSSPSSPPTSFSVLSLFFLENKKGNKERKRSNKSNWDSRLELLRGYVREPTAPTIVTRRPRPAFGEMLNYFIIMGLHTFISFFFFSWPPKTTKWVVVYFAIRVDTECCCIQK